MRRVGPLSGLPAACAQQRGNVNLPVKFRVRATEPSAEPELSLRATASGARLSGCVGPHRLRDSLRGARTSSSHCRRPHLHFTPLSDPQATTFLSPPGGIYLLQFRQVLKLGRSRKQKFGITKTEKQRGVGPVSISSKISYASAISSTHSLSGRLRQGRSDHRRCVSK